MKTINDLYKYASEHDIKLLSDYNGEWWADYRTNSEEYDKVFRRLYYSFFYFMQSRDEDVDEVVDNFTDDVENLLLLHSKEFSELYRVKVLAANAYGLTDNYDMTETLNKATGAVLGSRSDSTTNNVGAQTNGNTIKKAPYDTETLYNSESHDMSLGARQDSGSMTIGSQTNSGTENYTLTRKGNIGVTAATDVMQKHVDFWSKFNFYHYVFGVIAKELLTVGDGGAYHDDYYC